MSLLVFGTVALDDVKTPEGVRRDMLGGSAAHFSMAARLFTRVHLVGVVGKDFPNRHTRLLRQKKIDLTSLNRVDGKTFHWKGEYKKEDLNVALTLRTELGVIENIMPQVSSKQRNISHVFLANIDPDMQMQLLKSMRAPQLVGLDSMNLWIAHKRQALLKLIKKVGLILANDGEARALSGENNLLKAAKCLRRLGPKLVVIKKGEHGVLFYCDKFMFSFSAYPIERVVDPTGAGDTFAGGLMGYLTKAKRINEKTLKKAILYATTTASFNVQGFGVSRTAHLKIGEVRLRARKLIKFISVY